MADYFPRPDGEFNAWQRNFNDYVNANLAGLGLSPGPRFKVLLDAAYDAQLEGRVGTRTEALELVRSLGV